MINPVTVQFSCVVVHPLDAGEVVTVYVKFVEPPGPVGSDQVISACESPREVDTDFGAQGVPEIEPV